jgi:hypothetical protein
MTMVIGPIVLICGIAMVMVVFAVRAVLVLAVMW